MAGNWTYIANSPNSNHNAIELPKNTTENDLSNLVGVTGVTHSINSEQLDVYEVDENTRIVIRGTLYHDPDKEVLILHHNNKGISGATYNGGAVSGGVSAFVITGGNMYEKAYYYYGKEYTDAQTGRVTYSKGTGLIIAGDMSSVWHPTDAGLSGGNHNSFYVMRGGVVKLNRMISLGCRLDILKTTFVGNEYSRMLEMRNPIGDNNSPQLNATFDKIAILEPAKPYPINLDLQGGTIGEVTAGAAAWGENELRNLDLSKNTGPYDIGSDSSGTSHHQDWIIVNSATGTDVRKMWRDTRTNVGQRGAVIIKKEVSLNVKDGDGNPIEGAKVYVEDSPSPTARDTIFLASKSNTSTHPFTKPALSNADIDSDGNLIYYYANALEYNFTTDADGNTATEKITTGVNAHEYNASDSDALVANGGPYNIPAFHAGRWADDGSGNTDFLNGLSNNSRDYEPKYTDWDSDKFGGFYKVDRRGNGNTNADEFTFYFCSYGELLSNNTQSLKGLGELGLNWVLFDDQLITDTRATTDAYQEIDTPQKFYNRAKAYLVDNYAGETSTIVSREGNSIDAGSYNVVVDASASSVFAISSNTLTIKATTFVGNISTTGTTTLSNGAKVIGTFGATTVLPWTVKNVEGTTRLQLYNLTKDSLVVTQKLTGTAGTYVDASGTYTQTEIAEGDVVRLRCTCTVGAEAMLPVEITGVATSTGVTFSVDQVADEVYNTNGINGSTVEKTDSNSSGTLVADYASPMGVDVSDADGTASVKEIYAFFVYSTTTEDGVDKWFGGMRAIDNANYEIVTARSDIKIQNIGNNAVVVTNGRLFRDDSTSVLYAENGDKPISMDSGALATNVQPMVESALNANAKISSINNNTKIIPALL